LWDDAVRVKVVGTAVKVISGYNRVRIVSLALSVVIAGLLVLSGCGLEAAPEIGYPAPDFTLTDLDGNEVSLSSYRGKAVFLNFWATWCPPCRFEMPEMEGLYQEYKNKDVVIIGVDLMEYASSVSSFVEENGYSWTFVIDSTGEVTADYAVTGIPASFFIDKKGIIRALQVGAMSRALMETNLAEAMK
jgi:peroxiredoxin